MFKYIAFTSLAITSTEARKLRQKHAVHSRHLLKNKNERVTIHDAMDLIDMLDLDGNGEFDYWEMKLLCDEYGCDKDIADMVFHECDRYKDMAITAVELMHCYEWIATNI